MFLNNDFLTKNFNFFNLWYINHYHLFFLEFPIPQPLPSPLLPPTPTPIFPLLLLLNLPSPSPTPIFPPPHSLLLTLALTLSQDNWIWYKLDNIDDYIGNKSLDLQVIDWFKHIFTHKCTESSMIKKRTTILLKYLTKNNV